MSEKTMWLIVRSIIWLTVGVTLVCAFGARQTYAYEVFHTAWLADALGVVGLLGGATVLSGWVKPIQELIAPKSEGSGGASWIVALASAALIGLAYAV